MTDTHRPPPPTLPVTAVRIWQTWRATNSIAVGIDTESADGDGDGDGDGDLMDKDGDELSRPDGEDSEELATAQPGTSRRATSSLFHFNY